MSNERRTDDADINDKALSAAYAEIADERAPASLNERVLRDASRHAGKGYSYWMVWMRPMAWAATVGLCLAIVLELSSITQPDPGIFETARPAADDKRLNDARDITAQEAKPVNAKTEQLSAPARANDAAAPGNPATPEITVQSSRPEAPATERDDTAATDRLQIRAAPDLKEAGEIPASENLARTRRESVHEAEERATGSALAASSDAALFADGPLCDEQARATAAAWHDCIVELEKAGHDTDTERKAFLAAYPDYEIP